MKYLSDEITVGDIKRWDAGNKVLIHAGTGYGKTYFICRTMLEYCRSNNLHILFLVNRRLLLDQLKQEYGNEDNIKFETYQKFAKNIISSNDEQYDKYRYIVADECHYFFTDSCFNGTTDQVLKKLAFRTPNSTTIFMSASPYLMGRFLENECGDDKVWTNPNPQYPKNYNFYIYQTKQHIRKILMNIPDGEKAIMFLNDAEQALELSKQYKNAAFVCASNNKLYEFCDLEEMNNIIENYQFNSKYLFTTSVLDNGVSIKDDSLKHIIVDILDVDTAQQCFGRKRLKDNERVNIYVRQFKEYQIRYKIKKKQDTLELVKELKEDPYKTYFKYNGRLPDMHLTYQTYYDNGEVMSENYKGHNININTTTHFNLAYVYKLKHDCALYDSISNTENNKTSIDNIYVLAMRMHYSLKEFKHVNAVSNKMANSEIKKFVDVTLQGDIKDEFMEWFRKSNMESQQRTKVQKKTIRIWLERNNMPYELIDGQKNNKRYWILQSKKE